MEIVQSVLKGNKRSIARLITLIENNSPKAIEILKKLYPYTGNAVIIGITGSPGAGKSSLVNELAKTLRAKDKKVGILAIDPTSPFSGGALLGDRIRMQDLILDKGIYIRSMGSRGTLGGLSRASYDAAKVLDAAGMDYVIIETVGVGQSEVDIVKLADIVTLVLVPGMGDEVQAIKAGIMEIGDVFVVNKSDKDGADRLVTEIEMNLDLNPSKVTFRPPIIKTVATTGKGINSLAKSIEDVWKIMSENQTLSTKRKNRITQELYELIKENHMDKMLSLLSELIESMTLKVFQREIDPYSAMEVILKKLKDLI